MVDTIVGLFGGETKAQKQAKADRAKAQEDARIARERQLQDQQRQESEQGATAAALARTPRSRRLLTGDGGGATTLGG